MHKITITTLLTCLVMGPAAAAAEQADRDAQWRLCPSDRDLPATPTYSDDSITPGSTEIHADSTRLVNKGVTYFSGDVELVRDAQAIRGDVVSYDDVNSVVDVEGNAYLWDPGFIWHGERGLFDLGAKTSRLDNGRYWLVTGRGRGRADVIKKNDIKNITRLRRVDYTTCPGDRPDWKFSAKDIRLDHNTDRGSATHAVIKLRNIPVFYVPYLNFPLSDKRKTGFLIPTFGTTSESGSDIRIPYYWNIAPNHDATLTPRYISDRGGMLGGEYRYLYQDFEGEFDFEYLPSDSIENGADRSFVSYQHSHYFANNRGHARVLLSNVSDERYFEDFGQTLGVTSQRFLDRRVDFQYFGGQYGLLGSVQSYQSVDPSLPPEYGPYKRLPWIYFWGSLPQTHPHVLYSFTGDTTYFSRSNSVSGGRIHVEPTVSFPFIKTYASVVPRISVRHTEYLLDQPEGFDAHVNRTVPVFSLDSRLFAERQFSAFGSAFLQTLEPRAYYLLIPKQDQSDIPVFDTGVFDISFSSLFWADRFTGRDRVGDANQLSLAMTSRLLDLDSGREVFQASLGQRYFFRDREVTLPGPATWPGRARADEEVSELIAEVAARVGPQWWVRGTLQYDPNGSETEKAVFALRYQPFSGALINLGYRLRRSFSDVEQTDVSFRWPITQSLSLVGRWNYSLIAEQSLEAMGGIEYESCCWGVRFVSRRFLRNTEGEFDTAMFVQFELKGLAGYGRSTASFLKKSIPGYERVF